MKKILRNTLILILLLAMIVFHVNISVAIENKEIDYTETIESFRNPEKGFYSTLFLKMLPSGTKAVNPRSNLTHLRIGIGSFSGVNNGDKDLEFTEDALNGLHQTLQNAKNNGCSVIIRFAYDDFNGKGNLEPSLDMILKHISQLKPVLEANQDVISYIELGFFGPWGEMHTSSICRTENVNKTIDAMLDSAPEKIKIGVRTPNYYAKWIGIDRKDLNQNVSEKGTDAYRVGLYNDGYLGSESDLGTFANREIEITWLEKQAMHTLYGGEVVANYASGTPLNTVDYMSKEAFRTHTTYLNSEWNYNVINAWKNEIYNGDDPVYVGQTGYTYIVNHLGYRFVLRKSEITESIKQDEKLNLKLDIENVGFANLINSKVVSLVFVKGDEIYEVQTDIDATEWDSTKLTNLDFNVDLPGNMSSGEWKVYLRISQYGDIGTDNNYQCIRLANNGNMWKEEIGANYIGNFTILAKENEDNKDDNDKEEDNEGEDNKDDNNKEEDNKGEDNKDDSNKEEDNKNDINNGKDNNVNDKKENNINNKDTKKDDTKKVETSSKDNTYSSKNLPYAGGTTKLLMTIQLLIVIGILLSIHFYGKMKRDNNMNISERKD